MRKLENRPFELNQSGPVARRRLGAQLLGNRGRGASGEAEVPDGDDVIVGTGHC